jgi:hypothetical protein
MAPFNVITDNAIGEIWLLLLGSFSSSPKKESCSKKNGSLVFVNNLDCLDYLTSDAEAMGVSTIEIGDRFMISMVSTSETEKSMALVVHGAVLKEGFKVFRVDSFIFERPRKKD